MDASMGKEKECGDDISEVILSENVMKRIVGGSLPEVEPQGQPCLPITPQKQCLIENFKESGGINGTLEDAIIYFATVVERRAASIVRLQTMCCPERDNLVNCFVRNEDCSYKCSREVEAFNACVEKNAPFVIDSSIKSRKIDKEQQKRDMGAVFG